MSLPPFFSTIPFSDKDQAVAMFNSLAERFGQSFESALAEAMKEVAEGTRTLLRLERVMETEESTSKIVSQFISDPAFAKLTTTLLDQSQFLTDVICRDRNTLLWLHEDALRVLPAQHRSIAEQWEAFQQGLEATEEIGATMRRFHRREILRIGARDVYEYASMEDVTRELADLAEVMIEAAYQHALHSVQERFGMPIGHESTQASDPATFVVLGMGKLGGHELNFSSDIDLVFLYSEDGETVGSDVQSISNAEYFAKLGELLIKTLADPTAEGYIYRVDMRLRPHGRVGPLAVSLSTALEYYGMQGRPWERQALIKARSVGGDHALGELFVSESRPYVYPKYFYDETLEDIRDTKRQMESQVERRGETEIEVKLGRGGIRDIEFTVQMLQLLNGGRIKALRTTSTLAAIDALGRHDLLSPFDAQTLNSNYVFLRQVEHRIQIEGSQQRHALPTDPAVLDDLARRLGYAAGESFMVGYRDRSDATRKILDRFFAIEGSGVLWVSELLNPDSEDAGGEARLEGMGFRDGARAREELMALHTGTTAHPNSAHVRRLFREIAPKLIESFVAVPDPDTALMRMCQILSSLKAPGAIFDILKAHPALSDSLATLIANSQFLADILVRSPGLFDTFGYQGGLDQETTTERLQEELRLLRSARDSDAALYRLRNAEFLRIGMRDVSGRADVLTVGRELSVLANVCLDAAHKEATRVTNERFKCDPVPIAILGVGKLGGGELGYGSDLDVIFVYDSESASAAEVTASEYAAYHASHVIKILQEQTPRGMLYEVDSRLRPDGSRGPLAVSLARFESYYKEEAQAWERLALVKAAVCAGDNAFGERLSEVALECAYHRPLTRAEVEHTESLRLKLAAKSSARDVKKGEGGIAELEFGIRFLQMQHAKEFPSLRYSNVNSALGALRKVNLLSEAEESKTRASYLLLRQIENRLRMMNGRSESVLPSTEEECADLGRRIGLERDLAEVVDETMRAVHELYMDLLERTLSHT